MNNVFFLLGANLGDPVKQLAKAVAELEKYVGKIQRISSLYESEAWGLTDQPVFLNQVVLIATPLSALTVLDKIQTIENELGRVRTLKWGARVIDIDILYFNSDRITHDRLQIPHPYIQDRKFTLLPLAEIAPSFKHPVLALDSLELLASCTDPLNVKKNTV